MLIIDSILFAAGFCNVLSVRPKVAELSFKLYDRALHPELFEIHKSQEFSRGSYRVKLAITSAGHIITWTNGLITLSEVATSARAELPVNRKLLSHTVAAKQTRCAECPGGIRYEASFSSEPSTLELFYAFQQQLNKSDKPMGLVHSFESSGRMALGAISYIYTELRDRSFRVQAFHTFPDDCAIVKTESVIHIPTEMHHG